MWRELIRNLRIIINVRGIFFSTKIGDYLRPGEIEELKEKAKKEPLLKEE